MPKANVFNMDGKKVGEIDLSEAIFGIEPNKNVMYDSVKNHLANCRQGTQSALTKGEVSYTTKKPWRQKGTGRARQGSTRSPQWTHGGIALGPKPRDYHVDLNKKVKKAALLGALSGKVAEDCFKVIDAITAETYKTKVMADMLKAVNAGKKALVVFAEKNEKAVASCKNIPGVTVAYTNTLNVYDVLNCDTVVIEKAATEKITEVYA
jgi:large subunit ribosomal protein L4